MFFWRQSSLSFFGQTVTLTKVVLDQTARDMPEAGNKMRAGILLQGSIPAEGFTLTAGKRARLVKR
jgi:hypothetical protein